MATIINANGSTANLILLSCKKFSSFLIRLIVLINNTVIKPAHTDSSKTAAHGAEKVNNISDTPTLTKARAMAEKSIFLIITAVNAKNITSINKAR